MKNRVFTFLLILLLAAAAVLFWYVTPQGVGLTNDSAAYIGGARSILAGQGYSRIGGDKLPRPITQFPPLYALTIAGVASLFKIDALPAAWWVNLFCALLSLLFLILIVRTLTRSNISAILSGIAFLCCAPILQAQVYGLSEILYLPLFLILLSSTYRASVISKTRFSSLWIITGIMAGLLFLTRYAGIAAFAALILFILCSVPTTKRRLWSILSAATAFLIPVSLWLLRNRSLGQDPVNRTLTFHFPSTDKFAEGIQHIANFFLPEFGGLVDNHLLLWGGLILLSFLILLIWTILRFFEARRHPDQPVDSILFLFLQTVLYLAVLFFTALFVDGSTVFDDRMLLPYYVLVLLVIYTIGGQLLSSRVSLFGILALTFMLLFPVLLFEDELDQIREYHQDGQGFAGSSWVDSEVREAAAQLGSDKEIFSNRQTFLALMNNQASFIIPPFYNAANADERDNYEAERKWMQDEVLQGKAYVVVFNYQELNANPEDQAWLDSVLAGLPILERYTDGIIFGLP